MEPTNPSNSSGRASARDFFLHLGAMVGLYVVTASFLNLVFKIINHVYPTITTIYNNYYKSGSAELSLPVATLIIVFPLFIFISRLVHRSYTTDPSKKELPIRKWLTYITLFVAGVILAGDLVMVLYTFLNGQELTLGFLLKALSVLLVTALIFGFYLNDIREKLPDSRRKMWAIVATLVVIIFIILGFAVLGSPRTQRLMRYDDQKISDLQNMQWQVISYWQTNGTIPQSLPNIPPDLQNQTPYEYRGTGNMTFEICAVFNMSRRGGTAPYEPAVSKVGMNENWNHPSGRHCFSRIIDPVAYPTQVRG